MNVFDGISNVILKIFTCEPDHLSSTRHESAAPPSYESLAPPSYMSSEIGRATRAFLRRLDSIENIAVIVGSEATYLKVDGYTKAIASDAAAGNPKRLKNNLKNLEFFSNSLFDSMRNSLTSAKVRRAEAALFQVARVVRDCTS